MNDKNGMEAEEILASMDVVRIMAAITYGLEEKIGILQIQKNEADNWKKQSPQDGGTGQPWSPRGDAKFYRCKDQHKSQHWRLKAMLFQMRWERPCALELWNKIFRTPSTKTITKHGREKEQRAKPTKCTEEPKETRIEKTTELNSQITEESDGMEYTWVKSQKKLKGPNLRCLIPCKNTKGFSHTRKNLPDNHHFETHYPLPTQMQYKIVI